MRQPQHALGVAAGRSQNAKYVVIALAPDFICRRTGSEHWKTCRINCWSNRQRELAGIWCKQLVDGAFGDKLIVNLQGYSWIASVIADDKFYRPP